ncbi:MAG: DUF3141 domain-containing protein [Pseudomonadota bacterium]
MTETTPFTIVSEPLSQMTFGTPFLSQLSNGYATVLRNLGVSGSGAQLMLAAARKQSETISAVHRARSHQSREGLATLFGDVATGTPWPDLAQHFAAYLQDSAQRLVLSLDTLLDRGDIFLEHEAAGCPPVLAYRSELVLDGASLPSPCNYFLLQIVPPDGVTIDPMKRPYMIIDPRAGHGGGIGGFKEDSQVGVGLRAGHPVYFVAFRRDPVEGQTIADVTRAEAAFVQEIRKRHPDAPKPVVMGNCQGGWATLILAASHPDLPGPVVANGAPVDAWAGSVGSNPMRYNGGILGGVATAMVLSDLNRGQFDGAHLVMNFEMLNPSRNFFRKYFDLYRDADHGRQRFLEFERWWGGFFLMNEAEIAWIVNQIFVGNRLARGEARLEPGKPVDLKQIRSPVIVFASHGDNITPPQQALSWILDSYADVDEIRIRGQRIIYMIHEKVGHLGIFVSSSVAKKEHSQVASVLQTIENLAPGLYEMTIDRVIGTGTDARFEVSFVERHLTDLEALDDGRSDETPFAAVSRLSEVQAEFYDMALRPWVKAMAGFQPTDTMRRIHPLRIQRSALSSGAPWAAPVRSAANDVRQSRRPVEGTNPFLRAERIWADMVEQSMDLARDMRDAAYEMAFFSLYANPFMQWFGTPHAAPRALPTSEELKALPDVQRALLNRDRGGLAEAVIRMLVMLAESRGSVRRDRLERASRVLTDDEPFRSLGAEMRAHIIHEQTLIAEFDPEGAIDSLPKLLAAEEDRDLALRVVRFIPGEVAEMDDRTMTLLRRFHMALGRDFDGVTVSQDPLTGGTGLP